MMMMMIETQETAMFII